MICPRCGADNADRAERCYLCEQPFEAPGGPAARDSSVEPPYATAPPPTPETGFQPPPGAYGAAHLPPPRAPKGSTAARITIAVLVVTLIVLAGVLTIVLLGRESYTINVPVPPGFREADERMLENVRRSMRMGDPDARLDHLFISEGMTSMVMVARQKFYLADAPPDDPGEAALFYEENRDEILDEMNVGFELAAGVYEADYGGVDITKYDTLPMNSGDTALHMVMSLSMQQMTMDVNLLIVVKGNTLFMIIVQGFGGADLLGTLDFLVQNITFDKR